MLGTFEALLVVASYDFRDMCPEIVETFVDMAKALMPRKFVNVVFVLRVMDTI
jgi:hypothetical protein